MNDAENYVFLKRWALRLIAGSGAALTADQSNYFVVHPA